MNQPQYLKGLQTTLGDAIAGVVVFAQIAG
jgi:hypothetical protein